MITLAALVLVPEPSPCDTPQPVAHILRIAPGPARQGTTVAIRASRGLSHFEEEEPAACARDWKVSHPKMVKLARDRKSLTIAADAVPGTEVVVSYRTRQGPVRGMVRIVAKDAVVLNGNRSQKGIAGCTAAEPVGELSFSGIDDFSVTYQPFETYKDYWGKFRFDPATGALTLTATGGNMVPPGMDLAGTARFTGTDLVLTGFDLGGRTPTRRDDPAAACTYRF